MLLIFRFALLVREKMCIEIAGRVNLEKCAGYWYAPGTDKPRYVKVD